LLFINNINSTDVYGHSMILDSKAHRDAVYHWETWDLDMHCLALGYRDVWDTEAHITYIVRLFFGYYHLIFVVC
jgi:hypothetical protein